MSETTMAENFSDADLARRRGRARRIGWLLGLAVLALYLIGFFIKR